MPDLGSRGQHALVKQSSYAPGGLLEGAGPVRGAVAGGSVVAAYAGAEVGEAARSVAAAGHVEQRSGVGVGQLRRNAGGVAGEGIDGSNDRSGDAGAAEHVPVAAVAAVAVVNCDPGGRVGDCRNIGHSAVAAGGGVLLPGGLADVGRAAAAGTAPDGLAEAGVVGGTTLKLKAADRGDGAEGCRCLRTVAAVAGADGDRDARVVVVAGIRGFAGELRGAVRVGDDARTLCYGLVDGGAKVGERVRVGSHVDDLAERTDRRDHLQ